MKTTCEIPAGHIIINRFETEIVICSPCSHQMGSPSHFSDWLVISYSMIDYRGNSWFPPVPGEVLFKMFF